MEEITKYDIVKRGHFALCAVDVTGRMTVVQPQLKVLDSDLSKFIASLVSADNWRERFFVRSEREITKENGISGQEWLHQAFMVFDTPFDVAGFVNQNKQRIHQNTAKVRVYGLERDPRKHRVWMEERGGISMEKWRGPDFDNVYLNGWRLDPREALQLFSRGEIEVDASGEARLRE